MHSIFTYIQLQFKNINELNVGKYTYGLNCPVYMFTTRPNCKSPGILQLLLNLEQQKSARHDCKNSYEGTAIFILGWTVPLGGWTNPSEQFAEVKLDSFPQGLGWK